MMAMLPQVDVFWTDLDAAASALPRWQTLLDSQETARAARFRFERDRNRYIASHGILRTLLGRTLDRAPGTPCFDIGSHGKPALSNSNLRFNLSHSHHLALFAISRDLAVGCDIEFHDARFLAENIPKHFFSPAEVAAFHARPPSDRLAAFFAG